jgi:hypothetical protein
MAFCCWLTPEVRVLPLSLGAEITGSGMISASGVTDCFRLLAAGLGVMRDRGATG